MALYDAYFNWAKSHGEEPMKNTSFGRRLAEKDVDKFHCIGGNYYSGVKLKA
jgi:phage/plasmid-associated DNA primase